MSPAEPLGLSPKPPALKISVTIVAKTRLKALFDMTNPPLLSWRPDVVERTDAKASTLGFGGGDLHSIGQLWESKVPAPAPEISLFLLAGEWPANARRASFFEPHPFHGITLDAKRTGQYVYHKAGIGTAPRKAPNGRRRFRLAKTLVLIHRDKPDNIS